MCSTHCENIRQDLSTRSLQTLQSNIRRTNHKQNARAWRLAKLFVTISVDCASFSPTLGVRRLGIPWYTAHTRTVLNRVLWRRNIGYDILPRNSRKRLDKRRWRVGENMIDIMRRQVERKSNPRLRFPNLLEDKRGERYSQMGKWIRPIVREIETRQLPLQCHHPDKNQKTEPKWRQQSATKV